MRVIARIHPDHPVEALVRSPTPVGKKYYITND
jgi:hypothetical protein